MRHSTVRQWIIIHSVLLYAGFSAADIPPTIVNFPTNDLDRVNDVIKEAKIPCEAVGTPPFTWVWKKFNIDNRHSLEINKITSTLLYLVANSGLLTVKAFGSFVDGYYQCFVSNSAGTVFSRKIKVKTTTPGDFLPGSAITVNVTLGRSKIIRCPPRKKSFGESYEWGYLSQTDGFKYLGIKENRYITAEGDLIFSYLKQSDIDDVNNIGGLQCRIDAGTRVNYSPSIILNIVGDAYNGTTTPSFAVSLNGLYNATEGESTALYCAAVGKPIPEITWMKDKKTIVDGTNSYRISKQESNSLLRIENVNKKLHEGQYQCTVTSNISASGERSFTNLVVTVRPKITSYPGINVSAMYGETLMLWCNVSGDPLPDVSWWMNGKQLLASERITLSGGTVKVKQVGVADNGCYQCVAENDLSMVVSQTHVKLNGQQPTFSESTRLIKVFRGRNATLYCNPKGIPPPLISWMKDNQPIDLTQPNSRFSNDSTDSLRIKEVQDGDERAFSCKATNILGEAKLMWNLQFLNNTVITQKVLSMQVGLGETAELHCKASADASLTVLYKWTKGDQEIVYNNQISWDEQKNVLRINKVDLINTGKYTCVAYTSKPYYSQDMAAAVLSIKGIPEPPQKLNISDCTNLNATLTWELGTSLNTTVTHLLIEEESSYNPGIFYVKVNITDPASTSAKLHLTPYSKFTFRMKAFSGSKASRESQSTKSGDCETKSSKPTMYPDNLRGTSNGANTLKLLWDAIPPSKQNGPSFVYNLRLKKKVDSTWLNVIVFPPSVSFNVSNAGVLTEWEFQVWGENREGVGPMSPIAVAVSGQDVPPVIENINVTDVTKNSFHVVWRAQHTFDGRIDGYKIYLWKFGKDQSTINVTSASACINTTCSYNVSGLAPGTPYEITLSAVNSRGASDPIVIKTFTTLDVPKTPDGLEGKGDKDGKLTITWNVLQADKIGGAWRYYVLKWKRTNDTTWNTVNITDETSTSYTVQNAGCFVRWEFRILAVNEIGSSPVSNRVVQYSGRCPPEESPQGLKIVQIGETSVDLEWDAVSDSSVYSYKVYYKINTNGVRTRRESFSKDWENKEYKASDVCEKEKCSVSVTELEAQTNYTMYVTSRNVAGEGPGSEMIVVKTNKADGPSSIPSDPWWKKAWFIAVIVCLILLIILLLVCIICCCKRKKESGKGKYKVTQTAEKSKEATAV